MTDNKVEAQLEEQRLLDEAYRQLPRAARQRLWKAQEKMMVKAAKKKEKNG